MLKHNQELLQEGLQEKYGIVGNVSVDKTHVGMRRSCAYCGAQDRNPDVAEEFSGFVFDTSNSNKVVNLMKCPCKLVYFCSTSCQTKHWPNHKNECKAARARLKN